METDNRRIKFLCFSTVISLVISFFLPYEYMVFIIIAGFIFPLILSKEVFEPPCQSDNLVKELKVRKELDCDYYDELVNIYSLIQETNWINLLKYLDEEECNDFEYFELACAIQEQIIAQFPKAWEESTSEIDEEREQIVDNLRNICGEHDLLNMLKITFKLENDSYDSYDA